MAPPRISEQERGEISQKMTIVAETLRAREENRQPSACRKNCEPRVKFLLAIIRLAFLLVPLSGFGLKTPNACFVVSHRAQRNPILWPLYDGSRKLRNAARKYIVVLLLQHPPRKTL